MNDNDCISFLQWALPRLHMRWSGFRKVRGQVCKRLGRRLEELRLTDLKAYCTYLENTTAEWHILDSLCRITISCFYRDRGIYSILQKKIFPELISRLRQQNEKTLYCWCIGAASGEEPYSLSLLWELSGLETSGVELRILATDVDPHMISRAKRGCYPTSSILELPQKFKTRAFTIRNGTYCLKEFYKYRVHFMQHDIRNELPDFLFDLICCRNLVYTYFSRELQQEITHRIIQCLKPDGRLVLGIHEKLPTTFSELVQWPPAKSIYRHN